MSSTQNHRSSLDPTDIAIIEVLQEDGRIAMSELGRKTDDARFVQTYIFNSSKVFASFRP